MLAPLARPAAAADKPPQPLVIGSGERLLVVAPHPDDEALGAAGLIQRVRAQHGSVRVVLVTAGDGFVEAVVHETGQPRPRPSAYVAYGGRRLRESRASMRGLDGDQLRLQFLGFPDGGLDGLLRAHWRRSHPERSSTTGASDPPYDEAVEPDVPYDGADLHRELLTIIREARPTIVVFPDPLDKHPDHRAAGLFTLLALDDWVGEESKVNVPTLRMLVYLIHWPGWPPGWDAVNPTPDAANAALPLPADLPPRKVGLATLTLSDGEIAAKRAAVAKYVTQQEVMAPFLAAFVRRTEPFAILTTEALRHLAEIIEHRLQPQQTPPAP